jgi:hypothetical protein
MIIRRKNIVLITADHDILLEVKSIRLRLKVDQLKRHD